MGILYRNTARFEQWLTEKIAREALKEAQDKEQKCEEEQRRRAAAASDAKLSVASASGSASNASTTHRLQIGSASNVMTPRVLHPGSASAAALRHGAVGEASGVK